MKLPIALGLIVLSSSLSAGCASAGGGHLGGASPVRTSSVGVGASVSSAAARDIGDDRVGGSMVGALGRDDFHVNEAASASERDPQFAGPTPQVPIPRDGRPGQPTDW